MYDWQNQLVQPLNSVNNRAIRGTERGSIDGDSLTELSVKLEISSRMQSRTQIEKPKKKRANAKLPVALTRLEMTEII